MPLFRLSGGTVKELDKKKNNGVGSINKSCGCIRRASNLEFYLLNYRQNIEWFNFTQFEKHIV